MADPHDLTSAGPDMATLTLVSSASVYMNRTSDSLALYTDVAETDAEQ